MGQSPASIRFYLPFWKFRSFLPSLNRMEFPGRIGTWTPVFGFRPTPYFRRFTSKTPKPRSSMRSPAASACLRASRAASTVAQAFARGIEALSTTRSTILARIMSLSAWAEFIAGSWASAFRPPPDGQRVPDLVLVDPIGQLVAVQPLPRLPPDLVRVEAVGAGIRLEFPVARQGGLVQVGGPRDGEDQVGFAIVHGGAVRPSRGQSLLELLGVG